MRQAVGADTGLGVTFSPAWSSAPPGLSLWAHLAPHPQAPLDPGPIPTRFPVPEGETSETFCKHSPAHSAHLMRDVLSGSRVRPAGPIPGPGSVFRAGGVPVPMPSCLSTRNPLQLGHTASRGQHTGRRRRASRHRHWGTTSSGTDPHRAGHRFSSGSRRWGFGSARVSPAGVGRLAWALLREQPPCLTWGAEVKARTP